MAITALTLKKLFALSGNVCAFPRCRAPIYDTEEDVITGEICHIKGKSPNGPRYDPDQGKTDRDGYANLVLMCSLHNKIIDDPATRQKYTVEVLTSYKEQHEAQYKNSVVQPALLQRFVNKFREIFPPVPPPSMIRIAISFLRKKRQIEEDEYRLRIRCSNRSDRTIDDLRLEVNVPSGYELALFEVPQKVEGRSAVQTRTRVLLQLNSLRSAEHVGLRMFLSVPIERYESASNDNLCVTVSSGDRQLERRVFGISMLLDGLRTLSS